MKERISSKMALRALISESKENRDRKDVVEQIGPIVSPSVPSPVIPSKTIDERRKEQLRVGKVVLDFFANQSNPTAQKTDKLERRPGRPKKLKGEKAKNITICLSQKHIEYLDTVEIPGEKVKGRGTRVQSIIRDFQNYRSREREQVKVLKEALSEVDNNLKEFSARYKRAEEYDKTDVALSNMEKAIQNVRILLGLLKITPEEYKLLLSEKDYSTYGFCLNWISNRSTSNN